MKNQLHRAGAPPAAPLPERAAQPGDAAVLVIDDEPSVRRILGRLLTRNGFSVTLAEDGQQGIELVSQQPDRFSLVLLDQTMPGLSGEATLAGIRKRAPDLPVLLCTGGEHRGASGPGSPFDGVVEKPFSADMLLEAMRRALRSGVDEPDPSNSGAAECPDPIRSRTST